MGKIVGGAQVVERNHWPWMASVGDFCGGSIVGDQWILTGSATIVKHLFRPNRQPIYLMFKQKNNCCSTKFFLNEFLNSYA